MRATVFDFFAVLVGEAKIFRPVRVVENPKPVLLAVLVGGFILLLPVLVPSYSLNPIQLAVLVVSFPLLLPVLVPQSLKPVRLAIVELSQPLYLPIVVHHLPPSRVGRLLVGCIAKPFALLVSLLNLVVINRLSDDPVAGFIVVQVNLGDLESLCRICISRPLIGLGDYPHPAF